MSRRWIFSVLVAALALALATTAAAGGKKGKKGKKAAPASVMDKDLENEVFVVLERGTRSADMETRATAVEYIAHVRPETVKDYVVDSLKDPQWVVRYGAVKALILIKDPAYRKSLGAAVANSTLYEKRALSPSIWCCRSRPRRQFSFWARRWSRSRMCGTSSSRRSSRRTHPWPSSSTKGCGKFPRSKPG